MQRMYIYRVKTWNLLYFTISTLGHSICWMELVTFRLIYSYRWVGFINYQQLIMDWMKCMKETKSLIYKMKLQKQSSFPLMMYTDKKLFSTKFCNWFCDYNTSWSMLLFILFSRKNLISIWNMKSLLLLDNGNWWKDLHRLWLHLMLNFLLFVCIILVIYSILHDLLYN